MNLKRVLVLVLLFGLVNILPLSAQTTESDNSEQLVTASTPELWVWKFEVGHPYPNPCTIDWVKVNLNLLAMDVDFGTYNIKVTSKVYNVAGQQVRSTDHGWIASSSSHPIVVIPNASSLGSGVYTIKITGSCPTFGTSTTVTKKSTIL